MGNPSPWVEWAHLLGIQKADALMQTANRGRGGFAKKEGAQGRPWEKRRGDTEIKRRLARAFPRPAWASPALQVRNSSPAPPGKAILSPATCGRGGGDGGSGVQTPALSPPAGAMLRWCPSGESGLSPTHGQSTQLAPPQRGRIQSPGVRPKGLARDSEAAAPPRVRAKQLSWPGSLVVQGLQRG